MMGEDNMGRRLSDFSGTPEMVNLMLEMQQNSLMLKNVAEKVQGLPELTRKVDVLVTQMDIISEEVDSIQKIKELVDWHEKLGKLIAGVCTVLFPALLTSIFWLATEMTELKNKQTILEFKLQYMEKLNEKSATHTDSNSRDDKLSWHFWDFDGPRVEEFLFAGTNLEKQSSECELHTDRKLYVHL
jgi:hypothetical protein